MAKSTLKIALIGNPNTGKTSIFNRLTGLNQKVGNYPGITVEKKQGSVKLSETIKGVITDLPGTYSLNANSLDESLVVDLLLDQNNKDYPDVAVIVTEIENLKRNLLLFTQVKDLGIPCILAINMADRMDYKGISIDIPYLEQHLKTKIALISSKKGTGFNYLKELIVDYINLSTEPCFDITTTEPEYFKNIGQTYPDKQPYKTWLGISQEVNQDNPKLKERPFHLQKPNSYFKKLQQKETIKRYQFINEVLKNGQTIDTAKAKDLRSKLDKVLTHKVFGYVIFFAILLLIFQAIFSWASIPMDYIDEGFAWLGTYAAENLPEGILTELLSEGIIPGIGGVVIFIPQIAFLFLFISILEETGYMSRVVFLMDKLMKPFGLSGKSVVPLISGTACAIPAIMATRNIENWRERLITILVTPFTTCSARIPVYTILIALIIPEKTVGGIFNLQGLTLMVLYLLGFAGAIGSAYILNKLMKLKTKSFFVVEMPDYKLPLFKNVLYNVIEKTKAFVYGAGKIILALSIIIWFLGSHGPGEKFESAAEIVSSKLENSTITPEELDDKIAAYQLENSYIGIMGKAIEPVIRPLGYDWKIGIAIVTSFAAREVFVGTLATIYNIGSAEEEATIKERMEAEINPVTRGKVFNFATGISLLLFYAFAMQCISTLAITKKETNSWKWPLVQLFGMSIFAYIVSMIAYQLLK